MFSLRHTFAALAILAAVPASSRAQTPAFEVASLRGIRRVRLIVEAFHANLASVADSNAVRTQVELKLREDGITVVTDSAHAILYLQITAVHNTDVNIWAVHAQLAVMQPATLARSAAYDPLVTTFNAGETETVGDLVVVNGLTSAVGDVVAQFLNAWLEANPRSR